MEGADKIHVLVFPWLAFGHIIPFLEVSKYLAKRGHHVTFVSTPRNIERLPKFSHNLSSNINLVKLTLPRVDGLPENAEATMDIPREKIQYLKKAMDGLEQPMSALVEDIVPDWIIHDFFHHWLPPVATKFGIPCAYFSVFSASTHIILGGPQGLLAKEAWTVPDQLTSPRPWVPFPTEVAYRHHEAVLLGYAGQPNVTGLSVPNRIGLTVQGCDMFSVRSCNEFEGDWLSLLGELYQKPVIAMGTIPPLVPAEISSDVEEDVVKMWLDKQANGSTVYIAFGSEVRLSKEQWHELAYGLEKSKLAFVWALRCTADELDDLLPEGFEDRTKDYGVVHKGWVSQLMILAHSSVGGFLTHGGWGSVNEGLAFGKPLIVFPVMGDQGLNARVVGEKKVGAEVPRNERDGSFDRDAVAKILRLVMVDAEGEIFRSNARSMKEIFGDHSLQDRYMDDFVEYLKDHKR